MMSVFAERSHPRCDDDTDHLIRVLRQQAADRPDQHAFIHLRDDLVEETAITFSRLDKRARAIAAELQERGMAGRRIVLAYPPGVDFIEGLFGCLYAGCIAVPTSLAHRRRRLERFAAIISDAEAKLILSTAQAISQFQAPVAGLSWIATDEIGDEVIARWRETNPQPDSLAMLQYTSGSTSVPKGVMLSHANLMHNTRAIIGAFGASSAEQAVFWLPTYHDMGLVGGVLAPVAGGITNVTMSPTVFLQSPLTWLSAISRYRATISGGPNFAYDLCARKITDEEKASLDLSSWDLAFVGAEPVQAETLGRFAEAFAPCGFRASSFYPCYGLAEATLMVTGPKRGQGATVLENGSHKIVGCGEPAGGASVVIVDPENSTPLSEGTVGEIWIAGPSVGQGYWKDDAKTRRGFRAHLASGEGPYFRTGDLGFIRGGQLYITGRRDDLIIIRGVNRYPHDLEASARSSHPSLADHRGAAFAISDNGFQRHVLVHEATRSRTSEYSSVIDAASQAILDEHDMALDAIVLVRGGTIPRTSSGKIQRHACRDAFLAGQLHVLAQRINGQACSSRQQDRHRSSQSPALDAVCQHARAINPALNSHLDGETAISALGLDSLQRVELLAALEKSYGGRLPNTCDVQTLGQLTALVQKHLIEASQGFSPETLDGEVPREHYEVRLFPEIVDLRRHEQVLLGAAEQLEDKRDALPYFRADEGSPGLTSSSMSRIRGRDVINFCGYDYLGMSRDPEVSAAAKAAIERYGTSAGASRLVSGEKQVHRDLENALARFLGTEDAIAFVSGHAANVTTIGHLLSRGDLIVHDALAHNSIIQGAMLSGADHRAFPHNDWQALDRLLTDVRRQYRRVLIAIEGVYSMDGDWPELPRFIALRKKHKAMLLVDEAHSIGTMGATGRGVGEHYGVDRTDVDLWMGTLSKTLASCGGFIAGSGELVNYLKYTAPGFVYSVGLSPPNAAAALAAVTIMEREPQRVAAFRKNAAHFLELARQRGFDTGLAVPGSPVVPVIIGNSVQCLRVSGGLFARGINVQPILRPAVAENAARLRFFITINHSEEHIESAIDALAEELAARVS